MGVSLPAWAMGINRIDRARAKTQEGSVHLLSIYVSIHYHDKAAPAYSRFMRSPALVCIQTRDNSATEFRVFHKGVCTQAYCTHPDTLHQHRCNGTTTPRAHAEDAHADSPATMMSWERRGSRPLPIGDHHLHLRRVQHRRRRWWSWQVEGLGDGSRCCSGACG